MSEPIRISSDRFVCELSADAPAAIEVAPGSVLEVHCRSAADRLVGRARPRADRPNPATGPVAVAGAEPGHALRFDILAIDCESPGHVSSGREGEMIAVEIHRGCALFCGIEIPLAPMLGVLGVAPDEGSWDTMTAGPFGGNMDTNDVAPGAAVYVPVRQPGGKFVLGDVHAVMGDGEIGGQGLEAAATVSLRVSVEAEPASDHILIVRDGQVMTVGSGRTIEAAVFDATDAMVRLIAGTGRLDPFQTRKFLGLAGRTLFGQHCCEVKTVRVAVPLRYVPLDL